MGPTAPTEAALLETWSVLSLPIVDRLLRRRSEIIGMLSLPWALAWSRIRSRKQEVLYLNPRRNKLTQLTSPDRHDGNSPANCGRTGDRKIQRCRSCARMRRITFDDPSSGLGGRLSVRSVCRHSEGTFHRELFETTEMTVLWDSILLRRGKGQESMNP